MSELPAPSEDVHALCRRKLSDGDRTDYYSALFAPADRRDAAFALLAWWREVREIIDECTDAAVAQRKLAWWREEVQGMFAGRPRHPIAIALTPSLTAYALPEAPFFTIIDELTRHTFMSHYETYEEWLDHARDTRGQVLRLIAVLCGQQQPQTLTHATELGALQALAFALRDVGADARRGYLYLPANDLAQFRVSADDIFAGRDSGALRALIAFETERLISAIDAARQQIPASEAARQLPLAVGTDLVLALLNEIRADGHRVLTHRLELTPFRQLWRAWRSSRHARRAA